jgi:hypothetical protein
MTLQTMSFIFGALLLAVGILGGGFEVKEVKVSNVTTTARIAAAIVGVIFVALGFWQPGSSPFAISTPPSAPAVTPAGVTTEMGPREHDKNRNGGDYSGFDVLADHIETCEDACRSDVRCLAWTYVKPDIQGPQARCYLKNVTPAVTDNACCVSGAKIRH